MTDIAAEISKISSKLQSAGSGKRKKLLQQLEDLTARNNAALMSATNGLIASMGDGDPAVVGKAGFLLDKVGRSKPALCNPAQANALKWAMKPATTNDTMEAKGNSAKVLGHIAQSNPGALVQAVNPLLACLKPPVYVHDNPTPGQISLYSGAAFFLGNIVAFNQEYIRGPVPAIGIAARNSNADVRFHALLGMEAIAKKHPEYVAAQIPSVARSITYPLYRADNTTPMMDRMYISALYIIGRVAQTNPKDVTEAIGPVVSCLRDTYTFAQWCSAEAVKNPGGMRAIATNTLNLIQAGNPEALLPALIERLGEEREVGEHMEKVFYGIAQKHPTMVAPFILPGLNKPSPLVRRRMITAIGYIGPTQPVLVQETIPNVLVYITDRDRFLRRAAVFALGGIARGSPDQARDLIPKILTAFDDTYENVQLAAIEALEGIWLTNPKSMGGTIHTLNRCLSSNRQSIVNRANLTLQRLKIDPAVFDAFVREMENTKKVLDEAVRAGTSVAPAEEELQKAYREIELRNWQSSIAHVKEAGEVMKKMQLSSRPNISAQATTPTPFVEGQLIEINLKLTNTGTATAKQINMELPKTVEVSGMGLIPPIDPGKTREELLSCRPIEPIQRILIRFSYKDNDNLAYSTEVEVMHVAPGQKVPQPGASGAQLTQAQPEVVAAPSSGTSSQFEVSGTIDFSDPRLMDSKTHAKGTVEELPETQPMPPEQGGAAPPGMKYCMHCNTAIPAESVYCYKCGKQN